MKKSKIVNCPYCNSKVNGSNFYFTTERVCWKCAFFDTTINQFGETIIMQYKVPQFSHIDPGLGANALEYQYYTSEYYYSATIKGNECRYHITFLKDAKNNFRGNMNASNHDPKDILNKLQKIVEMKNFL